MNRYSTEEKQQAIDLYFKNGCNMKKTVRELGYGSATGILRWLRETVPDKVSRGSHGDRAVAQNVSLPARYVSPVKKV